MPVMFLTVLLHNLGDSGPLLSQHLLALHAMFTLEHLQGGGVIAVPDIKSIVPWNKRSVAVGEKLPGPRREGTPLEVDVSPS